MSLDRIMSRKKIKKFVKDQLFLRFSLPLFFLDSSSYSGDLMGASRKRDKGSKF